jgi:hypothetical protein
MKFDDLLSGFNRLHILHRAAEHESRHLVPDAARRGRGDEALASVGMGRTP